jgi:hypothetical protein
MTAIAKLEQLLNNKREKLVLPALYNLYKLYQITDATKAEAMKKEYLQNILNRVMHKS